ncbi:MAG: hypothetical protein BGO43_13195 [Gammaproteobacteria bacterium 39-13]|nr:MAG: hypothetical protein BGO43_13195 [Gammaproteobacteria bacterium 39-13]
MNIQIQSTLISCLIVLKSAKLAKILCYEPQIYILKPAMFVLKPVKIVLNHARKWQNIKKNKFSKPHSCL